MNFVTSFVSFILIAFDASDYVMETLEFSVKERFVFLRNNFAEYCGMGTSIGIFMLIPGLIVLMMPFMVIGASQVVASRKLNDTRSNT